MSNTLNFLKEINCDPEQWCSCYYCISHFQAKDIQVWTADESPQAICPKCMVDSVMLGYYENSKLEELYEKWFNTFVEEDDI